MKKTMFLLLVCTLLMSCTNTPVEVKSTDVPSQIPTNTTIPKVVATDTPVPTPTATKTVVPTPTITPTEAPKCPRQIQLPEDADLSVDLGEFGVFGVLDDEFGLKRVTVGYPSGDNVIEPGTRDLSLLREGKAEASFIMKSDGIIAADLGLSIFVNGEEFKVSSVNAVYGGKNEIFLNKGDEVRVTSKGGIPFYNYLFSVYYEIGNNTIGEGEFFTLGDESFPIFCDEERGHWYTDVDLVAPGTVLTITSKHAAFFVDTESVYSLAYEGFVCTGDLTGYIILPGDKITASFKGSEKTFRLVFIN